MSRLICVALPVLVLSCAESGGPVVVDASWNLTCPADTEIDCGTLAPDTCLGAVGQREIAGEHRQEACTGDPIIAICEAVRRSDGSRIISLEANLANEFAFELRGATVDVDGTVEPTACNITIIENEVPYDVGSCGEASPSMEQPCQLTNVVVEGSDVVFGLECRSLLSTLLSGTTAVGFDVGAVGGGPTTIRFANCIGF